MSNLHTYKYGVGNAILVIFVCFLFLGGFVYALMFEKQISNFLLAGTFAIAACIALYFVVIKEVMHFINGHPAITFNEIEIIDHRHDFSIKWFDIKTIQLIHSKRGQDLVLTLKTPIIEKEKIFISLAHIQGDENEIYYASLSFFHRYGTL